ncbi:MAG: hypothetical protein KF729_14870 [Sandaracinaceae bacterium]|nr:hypothetical protein [Sandaracinaceae bacterium]
MTKPTIRATLAVAATLAAAYGCDPYCEPAPDTICTIAGRTTAGFSGDGADARDAELYLPMDMAVGPDGRVYVADWNNHRIRAFAVGGAIETVAGTGLLGDGPLGPAVDAAFNHPTSVLFDLPGRMYIAAWHNSRIRRVDLATGALEDVCGTGGRAYAGDGGPALTAVLDLPAGLAFDPDGNLLVVDQANQVIRRIAGDGMIHRVAGACFVDECAPGATPSACPGTDKFSCTMGEDPTVCMNPCQPAFGGDGGPALEARFSMPFGQSADPAGRIAVALDGTMYLADTRNHRIRRIGTDGIVTTYAGTGTRGASGDGGPATAAELNNPVDLAVADDGTLYLTDTFNSCVRAIDPAGTIRTVAGICGRRGFGGDGGPPDQALLDRPYGLELHGGRLYIADTHNQRVRVIVL